jgi:hypothetical protein
MPEHAANRAVAFSVKAYQRLLAAYPKAHREDYGTAMAQLFRDQCRDAWSAARGWGLVLLWLRVLPDLVRTSVWEHLTARKERRIMIHRMLLGFRPAPLFAFFTVFTLVFLLVVTAATIVTFILPETYLSTARLRLEQDVSDRNPASNPQFGSASYDPYFIQTEFEIIQSQVVLGSVIDNLNLNAVWGRKFAGGERLKTSLTLELLRRCLDLRPVRKPD